MSDENVFLFPLAPGQERIWFLHQLSPGSALFNLNTTARLSAPVDTRALQSALDEIARRHEALRTRFRIIKDQPAQVVFATAGLPLRVVDLTDLPPAEARQRAHALVTDESLLPFELASEPLARTTLLRLAPTEALLSVTMHHIISDGWSIGLFYQELSALWSAFATRRPSPLPELAIQYGDYAVWERDRLAGTWPAPHLAYWRSRLAGAPTFELPPDRPRPPEQTFAGATVPITIEPPEREAIEALARAHGTTPFMTLLAAFLVLLHRYTSDTDIVIGSYVAGRNRPELESLIGFFLNTVPLRFDVAGDPSFVELLSRVRTVTLEAYDHQDVPFARLIEELRPERDPSRNPLCQVVFQMINVPTLVEGDEEREAQVEVRRTSSAFDLTCTLWASGASLRGHIEYSTDLFDAATMARLVEHYGCLLHSVVRDPTAPISALDLLPEHERRWMVHEQNQTARPFPDVPIAALLEDTVDRHGDAIAFTCGDESLTYSDLNGRANQLAHHLKALGAAPETIVGVCLERSLEACVALLAVLKSGAGYLPLDPAYPKDRLAFMVDDARALALVTSGDLGTGLGVDPTRVVRLDADRDEIVRQPDSNPGHRTSARSLAYVIYTSGSTGQPKGVAVEQRQIVNRLTWMWEAYPFREGEVGCQKTALSFVDSLWELLGPLLRGVPTMVAPDRVVRDPSAFVAELARTKVTRLWVVPTFLSAVLDAVPDLERALPALRFWVTSGEPLSAELDERFRRSAPHAVLYNLYGTSEVWDATWFDPTTEPGPYARPPIGRPISNVRVYVLDGRRQAVPIGVPGELYVGGVGVGRGYLNRPEINRRRFIPDPFSDEPGALLYATGDVVRYLPDGNIEHLTRSDDQIKIRGHRIELTEVDSALAGHPGVRDALVAIDANGDDPKLVAYVVPANGAALDPNRLRAHLSERLPTHMVPAAFVPVDTIPVTPSGKRDRLHVPATATRLVAEAPYTRPTTQLEKVIAGIWQELLEVDRVGRDDNFFDLGGHSLLLLKLRSRLEAVTGAPIEMNDLFRFTTVKALAARCAREVPARRNGPGPALAGTTK